MLSATIGFSKHTLTTDVAVNWSCRFFFFFFRIDIYYFFIMNAQNIYNIDIFVTICSLLAINVKIQSFLSRLVLHKNGYLPLLYLYDYVFDMITTVDVWVYFTVKEFFANQKQINKQTNIYTRMTRRWVNLNTWTFLMKIKWINNSIQFNSYLVDKSRSINANIYNTYIYMKWHENRKIEQTESSKLYLHLRIPFCSFQRRKNVLICIN